jgi:hypothetical protein
MHEQSGSRLSLSCRGIAQLAIQTEACSRYNSRNTLLSITEKEKLIKDNVKRKTALVRKRVDDAQTVIKQDQADIRNAEHSGLTTREPEIAIEEMMITIRESLSDFENPDNEEDGKDKNV